MSSTTSSNMRDTQTNIPLGIPGISFGKVPSTRRILSFKRRPRGENFLPWFFFFVTHLKQFFVASNPALHSPSYNSVPGKLSEDFFSRINVPRGHSNGYLVSPGASTSPFRASRHSRQQGHDRHALHLRSRFDVPSQRSPEHYCPPRLVPSVKPAQRRYVCSFA
jgi:hypothetical protein